MKKFLSTLIMKRYFFSLIFRVLIFGGFFFVYITNRRGLLDLIMQPVAMGITPVHVLWIVFMVIMIMHIFPGNKLTMALRKMEEKEYVEVPRYSKPELLEYVQKQNIKAWMVLLVWLIFNSIFGVLYLIGVLKIVDMLMISVFFFLCDYICILFFCPFQTFLMKNKCCVNCRIYDWGHFMMFTPMLFIQNFYSWSLFVTSLVVLIRWEITYAQYPERFWSGSNKKLQCENCNDKICQIKGKLTKIEEKEFMKENI